MNKKCWVIQQKQSQIWYSQLYQSQSLERKTNVVRKRCFPKMISSFAKDFLPSRGEYNNTAPMFSYILPNYYSVIDQMEQ